MFFSFLIFCFYFIRETRKIFVILHAARFGGCYLFFEAIVVLLIATVRVSNNLEMQSNSTVRLIFISFFCSHSFHSFLLLFESPVNADLVYTFFYKHEGKFTPASIMPSFLRISGSNYAYDMLNIS